MSRNLSTNSSGGQRQILSLMMVLQREFDVLLLDEPTATLDEQNARMVFDFLHTLAEAQITLLVVCHDPELLEHSIYSASICNSWSCPMVYASSYEPIFYALW